MLPRTGQVTSMSGDWGRPDSVALEREKLLCGSSLVLTKGHAPSGRSFQFSRVTRNRNFYVKSPDV